MRKRYEEIINNQRRTWTYAIIFVCIWIITAIFAFNLAAIHKSNTDMVDTNIKECPFCGGNASIYYDEGRIYTNGRIECDDCEAVIYSNYHSKSKDEVYNELVNKWNRRKED